MAILYKQEEICILNLNFHIVFSKGFVIQIDVAELILECFPKPLWLLGFCFKTVLLNKQLIGSEILHVNSLNKAFVLLNSTGLILNSKFGLY
jgi:hypothetical protein